MLRRLGMCLHSEYVVFQVGLVSCSGLWQLKRPSSRPPCGPLSRPGARQQRQRLRLRQSSSSCRSRWAGFDPLHSVNCTESYRQCTTAQS